jgi:hypothetical protein
MKAAGTTSLLGLRVLYAALLPAGCDMSVATADAREKLPFADRIIDTVSAVCELDGIENALLDASQHQLKDYGDDNDMRDRIIALESFRVGVAVCWRLMTAVHGGKE